MRGTASFNRSGGTLKAQPRVLILCEDTKSGRQYIEDARLHYRVDAQVTHAGRTDPYGIVCEAIKRQKPIKRRKPYDKIYCVVDRDTHARFEEAIQLANAHDEIAVVRSYPCFEFWLLLHFGYSRHPFNAAGNESAADRVIRELKRKPGFDTYDKGSSLGCFERLISKLPNARTHAASTLRDSAEVGDPNPSTEMHLLIDAFESLARPLPRN